MLIGNYLMAYHAMPAHISDPVACRDFQDWILSVIDETWAAILDEFLQRCGARNGRASFIRRRFTKTRASRKSPRRHWSNCCPKSSEDLVGFAGIEMHRRILGLAHVAELDTIEDADLKARCEARCLKLGQFLVINRNRLTGMDRVLAAARRAETGGLGMKVGDTHYRSIWFDGETARVKIIDQRWLPHEFRVVELDSLGEFATAIRDMWVRGAPLIGATAAYGVAIEMQRNLQTKHSTMPGSGCTKPGRRRSICAGRSMKCVVFSCPSRKRTRDRRLPQGRRRFATPMSRPTA
jgi:hypothetical protein